MSIALYWNGEIPQHLVTNINKGVVPQPKEFGYDFQEDLYDALYLRMIPCLSAMIQFFNQERHRRVDNAADFKCLAYFTENSNITASCQAIEDQHYIQISTDLIERLAHYSVEVGQILVLRHMKEPDLTKLKESIKIDEALSRSESLTDFERKNVLESVKQWPVPDFDGPIKHEDPHLTELVIFHDLLRLLFIHEFAHGVTGHVEFFQKTSGIQAMPEVSRERNMEKFAEKDLTIPNEIPVFHKTQALELHADEFSVRWSVNQIIRGHDPVGLTYEQPVDLVDRLSLFNIAACLIIIHWTISDYRINPMSTFRVKYAPLDELNPYAESGPHVIFSERDPFKVILSSHPPAQLRYYRHFIFVQDLAIKLHSPHLGSRVGAKSYTWINTLIGAVSINFYRLLPFTHFISMTPDMYRLESYEKYLVKVNALMADAIKEYIPMRRITEKYNFDEDFEDDEMST